MTEKSISISRCAIMAHQMYKHNVINCYILKWLTIPYDEFGPPFIIWLIQYIRPTIYKLLRRHRTFEIRFYRLMSHMGAGHKIWVNLLKRITTIFSTALTALLPGGVFLSTKNHHGDVHRVAT